MHVYALSTFPKQRHKLLSKNQNQQLSTFIKRLRDGGAQGKLLRGHWLYEVKIQEKRVYYVSTDDAVLLVGVSSKKNQDEKIRKIVARKDELLSLLNDLINT